MKQNLSYAEKMQQANREAKATVVALVLTVIVWVALGFGLAGSGIEVFHTPIWIIGGTVGTWLFAIGVAVFMSKRVIADVDLDEECDVQPGAVSCDDGNSSRCSAGQLRCDRTSDLVSHFNEAGDSRG